MVRLFSCREEGLSFLSLQAAHVNLYKSRKGLRHTCHECMKIEHYQNKDETEVLNIWLKASEQAHAFAGVGFWCGLVEDMKQVYLPRARTWVCRDGGSVVGFVCLVGEGELAALFVAPERQCEGIGTALLDWVKERSKGMLTVGVYEENVRARAFYKRGGFEEIGSREDELTGSREYRMEWKRECP